MGVQKNKTQKHKRQMRRQRGGEGVSWLDVFGFGDSKKADESTSSGSSWFSLPSFSIFGSNTDVKEDTTDTTDQYKPVEAEDTMDTTKPHNQLGGKRHRKSKRKHRHSKRKHRKSKHKKT